MYIEIYIYTRCDYLFIWTVLADTSFAFVFPCSNVLTRVGCSNAFIGPRCVWVSSWASSLVSCWNFCCSFGNTWLLGFATRFWLLATIWQWRTGLVDERRSCCIAGWNSIASSRPGGAHSEGDCIWGQSSRVALSACNCRWITSHGELYFPDSQSKWPGTFCITISWPSLLYQSSLHLSLMIQFCQSGSDRLWRPRWGASLAGAWQDRGEASAEGRRLSWLQCSLRDYQGRCFDPVHAGPSFVRLQFAPPCVEIHCLQASPAFGKHAQQWGRLDYPGRLKMHEFDEADEDERPMAAELRTAKERGPRQFTVLIDDPSTGGIPDPTYPVGIFEVAVEPDSDPKLVAIIAEADLEGWLRHAGRKEEVEEAGGSCFKAPGLDPPVEVLAENRKKKGKGKGKEKGSGGAAGSEQAAPSQQWGHLHESHRWAIPLQSQIFPRFRQWGALYKPRMRSLMLNCLSCRWWILYSHLKILHVLPLGLCRALQRQRRPLEVLRKAVGSSG